MQSTDQEVMIVGAGLAGLRCAVRLTELGHRVTVLEAAAEVGGRIRTDEIDGFLCDHGFQVFNPAYPAVKRWVDVEALNLQHFASGALVRRDNGLAVLADPIRSPKLARGALTSGLLKPREIAALIRWLGPTMASPRRTLADADETLGASLDRAGVTGPLRREVLQPFLAGVSVDSHELTSAILSKLLVRMFALGRPGLPTRGMRAFPEQLAEQVRQAGGTIHLGRSVDRVIRDGTSVEVHSAGESLRAAAVVVAADPVSGYTLAGGTSAGVREPTMKGLVTWWFATNEAPTDLPLVTVEGRRNRTNSPGPVWNAAVVSKAAPSYAPPGRHLIAATTLLDRPDGEAPEAAVKAHLGEIYGCESGGWELVTRHHIPQALPAYPPLTQRASPVDLGGGVFIAGDHRDTPSIQGALVSGNRTAESVHNWLH